MYDPIYLPCSSKAVFDHTNGISYRCENCLMVVGSMGQPQHCQDLMAQYRAAEQMGGIGWDYVRGHAKLR